MRRADDQVEGYEAPIKRALWQRVLTGGVPRMWAAMWACACAYAGLLTLMIFGFKWVLVPACLWMAGHGALLALTLFDVQWDEMAIAQLTRRYKNFYDAG